MQLELEMEDTLIDYSIKDELHFNNKRNKID